MALVTRPFADVYSELAQYQPTPADKLLDLCRQEVAVRSDIVEAESADFKDMLHVAAVWIAEKKAREGRGMCGAASRGVLALRTQHGDVWRPTAPPRMPEGCTPGFPKAAYQELCEEEAELRRWLHGVQQRLRENIEHTCQEAYYTLTSLDRLGPKEDHGRARLEREEEEAFQAIKRRLFLDRPPEYYRRQAVQRFGVTKPPDAPPPVQLTADQLEAAARERLAAEEEEGRRNTHGFLLGCYDQLLFCANHEEIVRRSEIVTRQVEGLYPLVADMCRRDFGMCYYHTPAVFLHLRFPEAPNSCMAQMCTWHLAHIVRNATALRRAREGGNASGEHAYPEEELEELGRELEYPTEDASPQALAQKPEYPTEDAPSQALAQKPAYATEGVSEKAAPVSGGGSGSGAKRPQQSYPEVVAAEATKAMGAEANLSYRPPKVTKTVDTHEIGDVHAAHGGDTTADAEYRTDAGTVGTLPAAAEVVTVDQGDEYEELDESAEADPASKVALPESTRKPVFSAEECVPHVPRKH